MIRERLLAIEPAALLVAPLLVMAFTLTQALVARLLGVAIQHIALGFGPQLAEWGAVQLRAFPISAHIQFAEDEHTGGTTYDALSTGQKVLLQLSGPAVLALLTPLLWSVHSDLGLICGVLMIMNLLPMPGTAGGQALIALMEAAGGAPLPDSVRLGWMLVSLVAVWGTVGWLFLG